MLLRCVTWWAVESIMNDRPESAAAQSMFTRASLHYVQLFQRIAGIDMLLRRALFGDYFSQALPQAMYLYLGFSFPLDQPSRMDATVAQQIYDVCWLWINGSTAPVVPFTAWNQLGKQATARLRAQRRQTFQFALPMFYVPSARAGTSTKEASAPPEPAADAGVAASSVAATPPAHDIATMRTAHRKQASHMSVALGHSLFVQQYLLLYVKDDGLHRDRLLGGDTSARALTVKAALSADSVAARTHRAVVGQSPIRQAGAAVMAASIISPAVSQQESSDFFDSIGFIPIGTASVGGINQHAVAAQLRHMARRYANPDNVAPALAEILHESSERAQAVVREQRAAARARLKTQVSVTRELSKVDDYARQVGLGIAPYKHLLQRMRVTAMENELPKLRGHEVPTFSELRSLHAVAAQSIESLHQEVGEPDIVFTPASSVNQGGWVSSSSSCARSQHVGSDLAALVDPAAAVSACRSAITALTLDKQRQATFVGTPSAVLSDLPVTAGAARGNSHANSPRSPVSGQRSSVESQESSAARVYLRVLPNDSLSSGALSIVHDGAYVAPELCDVDEVPPEMYFTAIARTAARQQHGAQTAQNKLHELQHSLESTVRSQRAQVAALTKRLAVRRQRTAQEVKALNHTASQVLRSSFDVKEAAQELMASRTRG